MWKGRVLESAIVWWWIVADVTLIVYCFATSVVEHMIKCFAASCGLIFLLKFSSHFVIFVVFHEMSCIFATNGAIWCSRGSSPSSAFASTVGSLSSSPATRRLIKTSILLVRWWSLDTLFYWVVLWPLLQIVDCAEWSHILLAWCWWWPCLLASMNSLSLFASSSHHLILRIISLPRKAPLRRCGNSWRSELHTSLWPTLPWLLL